jgi:ATP-binding cassette subfamily F protein uup
VVEQYLLETFRGALLLVTHDRYLLTSRRRHSKWQTGSNSSTAATNVTSSRGEREAQQAARLNRQNFLRRELEWLRRQPKARTTKQAAQVARAKTPSFSPSQAGTTGANVVDVTRAGKTIPSCEASIASKGACW